MKTNRIFIIVAALVIVLTGALLLSRCNRQVSERTATERSVDDALSEAVKTALGASPSFKFPDVQVASFNGRVQLSGFVIGADQKSAAETIAKGVPGVAGVENQITLK